MDSRLADYDELAVGQRVDHVVAASILGLERERVAVARVALPNQKRADLFVLEEFFGLSVNIIYLLSHPNKSKKTLLLFFSNNVPSCDFTIEPNRLTFLRLNNKLGTILDSSICVTIVEIIVDFVPYKNE